MSLNVKNIPNVCFLIFVKKIRYVDIKGEKSHGSSTLHVKLQTTKDAERWRNSLPQGRAPRLVIQHKIVSPESIYIQVTLYGLNNCIYIFRNICMCVCIFNTYTQNDEKNRGQEFETKYGKIQEKCWREKNDRRNDAIIF